MQRQIGIGTIGMGWMGELHSRSHNQVAIRFPEAPATGRLVICADNFERRSQSAAEKYGYQQWTTDWREVLDHPEVEAVSITTPNFLHLEMAEAAAAAGKHIWLEKPCGRSPAETKAIADAINAAGVTSHIGFNYRMCPVVQFAKQIVDSGRLGRLTHFRGRFLEGYGSNPDAMLTWRFSRSLAGSGVVADMLSHVVDQAHFLAGPIRRLASQQNTFIGDRPEPIPGEGTHFSIRKGGPRAPVENEDYVGVLVEFANGVFGHLESCRVIQGEKINLSWELHGTKGVLKWYLGRMGELEFFELSEGDNARDGYVNLLASVEMPYFANFTPGDGLSMSYDDTKVIEAYEFLRAADAGEPGEPNINAALAVAEVSDAIFRSWESGSFEPVRPIT